MRKRTLVVAALLAVAVPGCGEDRADGSGSDCADLPSRSASGQQPTPPAEQEVLAAKGTSSGTYLDPYAAATERFSPQESFVLYGDPAADDQFAERSLGVWYSRDLDALGAAEGYQDDQRDRVPVRDSDAFVSSVGVVEPVGHTDMVEVVWAECDDLAIGLRSEHLSGDELVSMADHLDVSASGVRLEPGAVDGLEEVLAQQGSDWGLPPSTGIRSIDYYGYPNPPSPAPGEYNHDAHDYSVETWTVSGPASIDELRTLFRFYNPGARASVVRGVDALVQTDEYAYDDGHVVVGGYDAFWLESPTVAIVASGRGELSVSTNAAGDKRYGQGMTESAMRDFLDDLHAVAPEEVKGLGAEPEVPRDLKAHCQRVKGEPVACWVPPSDAAPPSERP